MLKFSDYLTIGLVILCFVWPMKISQYGMLSAFITRLFFVALVVLCMMGPCGWIRRHKSQKERERLLTLPVQTMVGTIPFAYPTFDSHPGMVPSGYSIGPGGNTYFHYAPGTDHTPTGRYRAHAFVDRRWIILESLPRDFSDKRTVIPTYPQPVTISYVTDADGTNYFISASQN